MDQREASPRDSDLPDHPEDPFPPTEAPAEVPAEPVDDDAEDFVEDEHEEDDEATMDEEEALLDEDEDELDDLEAEADMDIEELRKKYGYGAPAAPSEDEPCVSTAAETEQPDVVNNEVIESATNSYFGVGTGEAEEEEVDVDYEPPEKKEFQIRVDPVLYQAVVPETMEDGDLSPEHHVGTLLWSPKEDLSPSVLNLYIHEWTARRAGVETDESKIDWRDNEDALFALLSAAYSVKDAAAADAAATTTAANECKRTVDGDIRKWSEEEKVAFETGFKDNYKNFKVIRETFVPTRTLGELIQYYYQWKKTARFNEFRRGHIHAPRKDFMTEVMDQMEGNKRRREAAEKASATIAAEASASTTVIHTENDDNEVEYGEPPVDVWAAPQHQEQPTESA